MLRQMQTRQLGQRFNNGYVSIARPKLLGIARAVPRYRQAPADGDESAKQQEQRRQEQRRQEQLLQRRREVAARDIDMTGGVGDYTFRSRDDELRRSLDGEEEEPSMGVRAARGIVARVAEKWRTTDNKGEVFLYSLVLSAGIWLAVWLTDLIDTAPAVARPLRFVGLIVSGWAFWRYLLLEGGQDDLMDELEQAKEALLPPSERRRR